MTRTTILARTLAAVAAVALFPAIASAQTPERPTAKPAAQERQAPPRSGRSDHVGPERPAAHRQVADRRFDRADRDGQHHGRADRSQRRGGRDGDGRPGRSEDRQARG